MTKDPIWLTIFSALIGAGGLGYITDWLKQRRLNNATPKSVRDTISANAAVDSSLAVVTKARDELGEDNERLRGLLETERENAEVLRRTLYREREQHARERHDWEARESRHLARIDALEQRVTELLDEVHRLRADVQRGYNEERGEQA